MHISAVGINHSTAPVPLREKLAISSDKLPDSLLLLHHYAAHGVILSTCNRTEVYAAADTSQDTEEAIISFLNNLTGVSFADLLPHIYLRKNETAFGHLFRVASGLSSMIIGEHEILGQVGQALEAAEKADMVNLPLRNLFQQAIGTGRRVREETGISKNALSVSSVAVDLAKGVVGDLNNCRILVIGAGEAGRLVAKAAMERGASQVIIYNRSREKAAALAAALGTTSVASENLTEELGAADVAISCTAAPHMVLKRSQVEPVMNNRPDHPLVIIDIAVPRDMDPEINKLDNVVLYNIDDLTSACDQNRSQRERESLRAMAIIKAEADRFLEWWQALEMKPVVSALTQKAEDIRQAQFKMTLKKMPALSEEERENLEAMTRAIVTKVLHDPIKYLKENAHDKKEHSSMLSEIFRLDGEKTT
jgi:glutamyl-tRNA reductase